MNKRRAASGIRELYAFEKKKNLPLAMAMPWGSKMRLGSAGDLISSRTACGCGGQLATETSDERPSHFSVFLQG